MKHGTGEFGRAKKRRLKKRRKKYAIIAQNIRDTGLFPNLSDQVLFNAIEKAKYDEMRAIDFILNQQEQILNAAQNNQEMVEIESKSERTEPDIADLLLANVLQEESDKKFARDLANKYHKTYAVQNEPLVISANTVQETTKPWEDFDVLLASIEDQDLSAWLSKMDELAGKEQEKEHVYNYSTRSYQKFHAETYFQNLQSQIATKIAAAGKHMTALTEVTNFRLVAQFERKWAEMTDRLGSQESTPVLMFHGTKSENLDSIQQEGLLIPGDGNSIKIANGAAHGKGIYVAKDARLSMSFSDCGQIFACAVLLGKHGIDSNIVSGASIAVCFSSAQVLPVCLVSYSNQRRQS
eukprot:TRINITY_DN7813_c0_g1_i1.p1 TRINITY_DN7813_c0_g1~~TRINITY_DN7813_c0_g1_i1.p1  ORF type:complete len:352 (-),score=70.39 TRINITY_DN7813_c0_g1_i1:193-1248(-)